MGNRFPTDLERQAAFVFQELDHVLGCLSDEVAHALDGQNQLDPANLSKFVRALSAHKLHLQELTRNVTAAPHGKTKRQA